MNNSDLQQLMFLDSAPLSLDLACFSSKSNDLKNFEDPGPMEAGYDGPRVVREMRIIYPGKFTDMYGRKFEVTPDHIKAIESNFKGSDPPPLQADHSRSVHDTVGFCRLVKLDNHSQLIGLSEFLGSDPVDNVNSGKWRKFSYGGTIIPHPDSQEAKEFNERQERLAKYIDGYKAKSLPPVSESKMEHLAVTSFPACSRAKMLSLFDPLRTFFGFGGLKKFEPEHLEHPEPEPEQPETKIEPEPTSETEEKAEVEMSQPTQPTTPPAEEKKFELSADVKAQLQALEEENKSLKSAVHSLETKDRQREVESKFMSFVRAGKSVPAQAEAEIALMLGMTDEQLAVFQKYKDAQPKIVNFEQLSRNDTAAPGQGSGAEKLAAVERMAALSGYSLDGKQIPRQQPSLSITPSNSVNTGNVAASHGSREATQITAVTVSE